MSWKGSWKEDVETVLERDPAAHSYKEALLFSPGLHAILLHRFSHNAYLKGNLTIARMINYFARFITGADIHPGATIGKGFFIDHATGVVIGETSVIGENVSVFQGVTLGGVSAERGRKRHPTIGDNVVIGAHAVILGDIHIGENTRIGAGSVVIKDVPPNSTVVGIPGKVVRRDGLPVKVDMRHDQLPDPFLDSFSDMSHHMVELERRIQELEDQLAKQK
jgi:serine O-acetyltransferase